MEKLKALVFSFLISQGYVCYPKVCILCNLYLQVRSTNSEREEQRGKRIKIFVLEGTLITPYAISWYYLTLLISALCHSPPVLSEIHTVSQCVLITPQHFKVAPGITDTEKRRTDEAQKFVPVTRIFGQIPQPSAVSQAPIRALRVPTHRYQAPAFDDLSLMDQESQQSTYKKEQQVGLPWWCSG